MGPAFDRRLGEALELGEVHHAAVALGYIAASVTVGIAAVYAGTLVGRTI
jgi:fluoride ion exporter CrcB/FEX